MELSIGALCRPKRLCPVWTDPSRFHRAAGVAYWIGTHPNGSAVEDSVVVIGETVLSYENLSYVPVMLSTGATGWISTADLEAV